VLDDVVGVDDHAGQQPLAVGQRDVLPQMVFVLVTRVTGFERATNPASRIARYSVRSASPAASQNSWSVA
jgi:hypothetical protein